MSSLPVPPQRIQVLQVIGNAIVGGMETYVQRLIERLPPERFRVVALCPFESPFTDILRERDVDVVIAPMPEDPSWTAVHLACALIKAHAIDILHAHLANAHVLSGIVGRITGRPVLATIHGRQLTTLDLEAHRTTGTHLSVVCRQTYFHAMGLGVQPSQLHCIANGVDTQRFHPGVKRDAAWRRAHGVPVDAPTVGFVGRLSPEKGPEVFVRVAMLMQQTGPEAHFIVVGDGPMRAELGRMVQQLNLGHRVHFVGLQHDMPQVYAQLDVVVSTSHTEAMPFALMEAMSCGLPVVAPRVGGVPDLVAHGQTGWLTAPGADHEAAQLVESLLAQPDLRQQMGHRARERCMHRFSLDASVSGTMALLQRLVPARGDQRRISAVVSPAKLGRAATSGG